LDDEDRALLEKVESGFETVGEEEYARLAGWQKPRAII
jgi:hypothetical protein